MDEDRDEPTNEIVQISLGGENSDVQGSCSHFSPNNIGITTRNWKCGALSGDHELQSVLQWLIASQIS